MFPPYFFLGPAIPPHIFLHLESPLRLHHCISIIIRVARLAILTPNFINLTFLEAVGVKKIVCFFYFFFSMFGFFGGSWHTGLLSDWCFGFLNISDGVSRLGLGLEMCL